MWAVLVLLFTKLLGNLKHTSTNRLIGSAVDHDANVKKPMVICWLHKQRALVSDASAAAAVTTSTT